jgi:hypothetical protein
MDKAIREAIGEIFSSFKMKLEAGKCWVCRTSEGMEPDGYAHQTCSDGLWERKRQILKDINDNPHTKEELIRLKIRLAHLRANGVEG